MLTNTYLKVKNNIVENVEIADEEWINNYDGECLYIKYPNYAVNIGFIYDPETNEFNDPEGKERVYFDENPDDII